MRLTRLRRLKPAVFPVHGLGELTELFNLQRRSPLGLLRKRTHLKVTKKLLQGFSQCRVERFNRRLVLVSIGKHGRFCRNKIDQEGHAVLARGQLPLGGPPRVETASDVSRRFPRNAARCPKGLEGNRKALPQRDDFNILSVLELLRHQDRCR